MNRSLRTILVLSAAGLALTLLMRQLEARVPQDSLSERQSAAVEEGLTFATAEVVAMHQALQRLARSVAERADVMAALERMSDDELAAVDDLVRIAAEEVPSDLFAFEIFDPTPRLRAWNGFAMPMDGGPESQDFLQNEQLRVARDGDLRVALSLWHPIRSAGQVVGVVRALRMVHMRVPVRNEFLRDVRLDEDWSRETGLGVRVSYDAAEHVGWRSIYSDDGERLMQVRVEPPSRIALLDMNRKMYDGLAALFLTAMLLSGLVWVVRTLRRMRGAVYALGLTVALTVFRFLLLYMGVPERWQSGKAPLAPLFDPSHLASDLGFGLFRSIGDLALSSVFVLILGALLVARAIGRQDSREPGVWTWTIASAAAAALFLPVALVIRAMLLDSTLDYFARSGLLPERLVLIVFGSVLVLMIGAFAIATAVARRGLSSRSRLSTAAVLAAALGLAAVSVAGLTGGLVASSELVAMSLFTAGALAAARTLPSRIPLPIVHLRSLLLGVVVAALTVYPVLDQGQETKERQRMADAAAAYTEETDPRVLLAIEQVLSAAAETVLPESALARPARVDSLLDDLVRRSLIASLGTYDVSLSLLANDGRTLGQYSAARSVTSAASNRRRDADDLQLMRSMHPGVGSSSIERLTDPVERDRYDFVGIVAVDSVRWVLARASQHIHQSAASTPFPRVLVPAGYYGSLYPDLSIAEFRDGVLMRSFGSEFGRNYLDPDVANRLTTQTRLWTTEQIRDRSYITYYARAAQSGSWAGAEPVYGRSTVAVRRSSVNVFDRLYYLLRLTISGIIFGIPVYVWGLVLRYNRGQLPARRVRFRDKVLNAFFAVGLIVVAVMGVLGSRVVTTENDRAIESWLQQHLNRVEDALAGRARADEMPYRVLERTDIDSLAAQVGLDLNVYRGVELESTSRPHLVRDRLIATRLPIEAYDALFVGGFRFVDVEERLGGFTYTAGYRSLADEQGAPRYVISVPTLPEQERIEEERARTVAYLFGALLLLVLVVMLTAAVIANALARPLARIRSGLLAVAEGRFERIGPMNTRDELGELVGTFNDMQDQLADSRRLLAQQERQLAWREMARQVAHEIKNPLTPMKLSVQHLQRAYERDEDTGKFSAIFARISRTLIDQIDALARIANEFSSFARMPLQSVESLDLSVVMAEAASLMDEHARAEIVRELFDRPLQIEGDHEALRRTFINFIKNALEALDAPEKGSIRLVSYSEQDPDTGVLWAVGEVHDNGMGVPDELRDRIFNPSFSTKTSGTGLGLAIAKSTVEELQGRIGFETEEGRGSCFWVRIPLMPPS